MWRLLWHCVQKPCLQNPIPRGHLHALSAKVWRELQPYSAECSCLFGTGNPVLSRFPIAQRHQCRDLLYQAWGIYGPSDVTGFQLPSAQANVANDQGSWECHRFSTYTLHILPHKQARCGFNAQIGPWYCIVLKVLKENSGQHELLMWCQLWPLLLMCWMLNMNNGFKLSMVMNSPI